MASSKPDQADDENAEAEYEKIIEVIKAFSLAANSKCNPNRMTGQACGKMVSECLKKDFGKYDVVNRTDSSVFASLKDSHKDKDIRVDKDNVKKFCCKLGQEMAKAKHKDQSIKEDDAKSVECRCKIRKCLIAGKPGNTGTKTVKAGGVDRLTDTSKYTGAHKERFDKSGKGKGIDGREDRHANDGYVGGYGNKGTYDKAKK